MKRLMRTDGGAAGLILRLTLAIVIFPHGAQKALGWFGGGGFSGTVDFFSSQLGIPAAIAVLVIAAEFLGSLGLLFGFLTRICALGIGAVMLGAIFMVHLPNGFFMNWYGQEGVGQGYEFHLLAIGIALALLVTGGGAASVDKAMASR
jgi:putative oxidoreductase